MSVCLCVCVFNTITFETLDVESLFLVCEDISRGYGSSSYMKVIGSRSRSLERKAQNSLFLQCKTSIGNNSDSVEDIAVKFACSVGFLDMVDACDRKYARLRFVCLRLEGNLIVIFCFNYFPYLSSSHSDLT